MEIYWEDYVLDRSGSYPVIYHDACGPVSTTIVCSLREGIEWAKEHHSTCVANNAQEI